MIVVVRKSRVGVVIIAVVAALIVVAGLTGCGAVKVAPAEGIAFVVGVRANTPAPDAAALAGLIPTDLPVGSVVTVSGVSGSPDGVPGKGFTFTDMGNPTDNQNEVLTDKALLVKSLTGVRASTAEADLIGAMAAAARSIQGVTGAKRLIVADSTLSTSGVLEFQRNLLSTPSDDVVEAVPASNLPSLQGMAVTIVGQGNTVPPQQPLGVDDRAILRQIWAGLLRRAGVTSLTYVDGSPTGRGTAGVPTVTPVQVLPVDPVTFPSKCTAVIPQTRIQFQVGTAVFLDSATASPAITTVAAALKGCQGTVTVSGTTSSEGSPASNRALSLSRATTVRALLAPLMGRPVSAIRVQGLASTFPGFVPDLNPDGTLNVPAAEQDRKVIISVG
jgi:outer membrane protein OmpA-like peptidoglycan-associated protein